MFEFVQALDAVFDSKIKMIVPNTAAAIDTIAASASDLLDIIEIKAIGVMINSKSWDTAIELIKGRPDLFTINKISNSRTQCRLQYGGKNYVVMQTVKAYDDYSITSMESVPNKTIFKYSPLTCLRLFVTGSIDLPEKAIYYAAMIEALLRKNPSYFETAYTKYLERSVRQRMIMALNTHRKIGAIHSVYKHYVTNIRKNDFGGADEVRALADFMIATFLESEANAIKTMPGNPFEIISDFTDFTGITNIQIDGHIDYIDVSNKIFSNKRTAFHADQAEKYWVNITVSAEDFEIAKEAILEKYGSNANVLVNNSYIIYYPEGKYEVAVLKQVDNFGYWSVYKLPDGFKELAFRTTEFLGVTYKTKRAVAVLLDTIKKPKSDYNTRLIAMQIIAAVRSNKIDCVKLLHEMVEMQPDRVELKQLLNVVKFYKTQMRTTAPETDAFELEMLWKFQLGLNN